MTPNKRILEVGPAELPGFLEYCRLHGEEHDPSFVPDRDFEPGPETPAFALVDEGGGVAGVASLMLGGSWGRSGRGRFAILHAGGAGGASPEDYRALAAASAAGARGRVRELYLFLPESANGPLAALEALGFARERIVYGMEATLAAAKRPDAPEHWRLEAVSPEDESSIAEFVAVRNRNFKEVLGSHDASVEDIREALAADTAVDGGHLLLRDRAGIARGTLFLERDDEEGVLFVGSVSVDREARGAGLGRYLIRYALAYGAERGFTKAFLSVNALNRSALSLYEREGFTLERAMACLAASVDALAPLR
jgi:ribosomal protein S18 acetylase RimI-like enzyme